MKAVFQKLDKKNKGILSKKNLCIRNLNGNEMKLIQNLIIFMMNQQKSLEFTFQDFVKIVSRIN